MASESELSKSFRVSLQRPTSVSHPSANAGIIESRYIKIDDEAHELRADSADSAYGSGSTSEQIDVDDFEDEAYAESINSGYLTSLASDVRRGVLENGRVYPSYGRYEYGMPIDEDELDRNDLQHAKFTLLLNNQLFLSPIGPNPARILDIGTGTGIWAVDVGDAYPEAHVIGTDVAPVQPTWVPPNVHFVLEDVEDTWTFSEDSVDFIYGREISFAVRDWPKFIAQSFATLKPGGYLELGATYPKTHCDDGSLDLEKSDFVATVKIYFQIVEAMGASLEAPCSWAAQMKEAGFVDVEEHYIKMPMGSWPKDRRLKMVGVYELAQLNQGYEAYMIRGWTQGLRRPAEELYPIIAAGRKEINKTKHHTYAHFVVVTGRKPEA